MLCFELSGCAIYGVAPCAGARIEISSGKTALAKKYWSHPARVRESKSCTDGLPQGAQSVAPHAGARIKTAKKRDRPQRLMVHSALVSESKPGRSFGPLQSGQSYPARVRESKCKKDEPIKQLKRRTSRGCENRNHHKKASVAKIAPKHGCGN